jgi:lysyl oxidase
MSEGLRRSAALIAGLAAISCHSTNETKKSGALIQVSTEARVAVLLEDLPAELRDRAASVAIAEPPSFWIERAKRQIDFSYLRLTFRRYYSLERGEVRKAQLTLPPLEVWRVTPSMPERTQIDGHDGVAARYTMSALILSDADSPSRSEPALATIGGTWDESFTLPSDPDLFFARTGYSCMRETDTPPHSVDGENASHFFDEGCQATAPGLVNCHLSVPSTPDDCLDALKNKIGRETVKLHFERLPWDQTLADKSRIAPITTGGAPDLTVVRPAMATNRLVYRYIPADSCAIQEGCVGGSGWRRLLQFSADVANVGTMPVDIGRIEGSIVAEHNVYYFSPCHQHYHFRFYGEFDVGSSGGNMGSKRAFCLLSTNRFSNSEDSPLDSTYDSCHVQGITQGWADEYIAGLDCQWVDVTGVTSPDQTLEFRVNPEMFMCEGTPVLDGNGTQAFESTSFTTESGQPIDRPACKFAKNWDANNDGKIGVTIPTKGSFVTEPCTKGQLGPLRDCGFTDMDDIRSCTPGATVRLSCTSASPQILRACEKSEVLGTGVACTYRDSLATAVVGSTSTEVRFACPARRDASEPGGAFSLYASAVFDGDPPTTPGCTIIGAGM